MKHGHPRANVRDGSANLFAFADQLVGVVRHIVALLRGQENVWTGTVSILSRLTEQLHKEPRDDYPMTFEAWLGLSSNEDT